MMGVNERDENGRLTAWSLAVRSLGNNGCDCDEIEDDEDDRTCLPCRCEAAMKAERTRAEKAEAEVATLRRECSSISEEFGLPPTIRPAEGEIRRMLANLKAAHITIEKADALLGWARGMLVSAASVAKGGLSQEWLDEVAKLLRAMEDGVRP
jgi:hypothetical protein